MLVGVADLRANMFLLCNRPNVGHQTDVEVLVFRVDL